LRQWVADHNVWMLYTQKEIDDTSSALERLYRANLTTEGKLDYRLYLQILKLSLDLEKYTDDGKNLTGYHTVINQMEGQLRELWAKAATPKI
jgi:hypothetical protein